MVDPARLAGAGARLEGQMPLDRCARLRAEFGPQTGAAAVALEFGTDEDGVRFVRGEVRAILRLTCCRCLQPMELPVDCRFALGLAASDAESKTLPECYDPMVVGAEPLSVTGLVEDELLLALPFAPLHAQAECSAPAPRGGTRIAPGPFEKLAALRERRPAGDEN